MPEQIGPAAKLYERMNQICQSGQATKQETQQNGVIYAKIPPKPQTSPEQLRIEMEQQMEAKKKVLQQVHNNHKWLKLKHLQFRRESIYHLQSPWLVKVPALKIRQRRLIRRMR